MKEHNNRNIAKKYAEYITGDELRRYVARKVKQYVGDNPVVFDGAVGSGQLEQYVQPSFIHSVEIQAEACKIFKENYPDSEVSNMSFFNYQRDVVADCVIMNPPFSIMFKDLTEQEKVNIQSEFSWKKSGKVDDIFILKSLNYTKRYAFHICFMGVTYRNTEKTFRELLQNKLVEFNVINNAFEDTSIPVAFLVIDKLKDDYSVYKEIYDCEVKEVVNSNTTTEMEDVWERPEVPEKEVEKVDIDYIEEEARKTTIRNLKTSIKLSLMYCAFEKKEIGSLFDDLQEVIDETRLVYEFNKHDLFNVSIRK